MKSVREGSKTRGLTCQEMMEAMIRRSPQLEEEAKEMEEEGLRHHPGKEEQINLGLGSS